MEMDRLRPGGRVLPEALEALSTHGRANWRKVPEITLYFWIIKVLCTTVGETAADFLNINLRFGLTNSTCISRHRSERGARMATLDYLTRERRLHQCLRALHAQTRTLLCFAGLSAATIAQA